MNPDYLPLSLIILAMFGSIVILISGIFIKHTISVLGLIAGFGIILSAVVCSISYGERKDELIKKYAIEQIEKYEKVIGSQTLTD